MRGARVPGVQRRERSERRPGSLVRPAGCSTKQTYSRHCLVEFDRNADSPFPARGARDSWVRSNGAQVDRGTCEFEGEPLKVAFALPWGDDSEETRSSERSLICARVNVREVRPRKRLRRSDRERRVGLASEVARTCEFAVRPPARTLVHEAREGCRSARARASMPDVSDIA